MEILLLQIFVLRCVAMDWLLLLRLVMMVTLLMEMGVHLIVIRLRLDFIVLEDGTRQI